MSNELQVQSFGDISIFSPQNFTEAQTMAKWLAYSEIVPENFRVIAGKRTENVAIANCLSAIDIARRMNDGLLAIMQSLCFVSGKASWSGQFVIGKVNTCGLFSRMQFEMVGKEGDDSYGCYAWAVDLATNKKLVGTTITVKMAKAEGWFRNSKWVNMQQQMLVYRSASFWGRQYAADLLMGMPTADELEDIRDVTPQEEQPPSPAPKYARTKVNGVKEPVIESEKEEPKPEVPEIDQETGEVTRKSKTLQEVLAEEMAKQKDQESAYE